MRGPISIADVVDEYISSIEEPRFPDGKYHPSSYWGCTRKVIYELRGTPQSNPPDRISKRRFRLGHIIHEFVQTALSLAPNVKTFYAEFAIQGALEAGHGDGLIELEDDTWIVLEAKSARKSSFRFGLKEDHAKQASSYAVAARLTGVVADGVFIPPLGEKLVGVLVVYIEKEDLHIDEHYLPYDVEWESRVENRLSELEAYRADPQSLPPRLPMTVKGGKKVKNWQCGGAWGSCPFLDKCWKEDGSGVAPSDDPIVIEEW